MKASLHSGRGLTSAKHNDRSFLEEKDEKRTHAEAMGKTYVDNSDSSHINESMSSLNRIWTEKTGELSQAQFRSKYNLESIQREIYSDLFSEGIEAQNQRHIDGGHADRCKNVDDYFDNPKKGLRETILQIGNAEDGSSLGTEEYLWNAAMKLKDEKEQMGCHVVSMELHLDESSPHIHMQETFKSSRGMPEQSRALKEAGIQRPDLSKPEGKHNNALITYTKWERERFEALVRDMGLSIEPSERCDRKHETDKNKALKSKNDELEKIVNEKSQVITDLDSGINKKKRALDKYKSEFDEYRKLENSAFRPEVRKAVMGRVSVPEDEYNKLISNNHYYTRAVTEHNQIVDKNNSLRRELKEVKSDLEKSKLSESKIRASLDSATRERDSLKEIVKKLEKQLAQFITPTKKIDKIR